MVDEADRRAALQHRVKQLGTQFLERTARETAVLREHLAQLRNGDRGALGSVRQLTHKIHGSGATLGFSSIGDCAAQLERLAEQCLATPAPLEKIIEPLAHGIANLENEVAQALEDFPKTL